VGPLGRDDLLLLSVLLLLVIEFEGLPLERHNLVLIPLVSALSPFGRFLFQRLACFARSQVDHKALGQERPLAVRARSQRTRVERVVLLFRQIFVGLVLQRRAVALDRHFGDHVKVFLDRLVHFA